MSNRYHSHISCGIVELFGLWTTENSYSALYDLAHSMYREQNKDDLRSSNGFIHDQYQALKPTIANGDHRMWVGPKSFAIWSNPNSPRFWGFILAEQVRKLGLGEVVVHGPVFNPNTRNQICLFVWTINQGAYRAWYEKTKPKEEANQLELEKQFPLSPATPISAHV